MLIAQEYTLQTPLVGSPCRESGSSGFPPAGDVHDSYRTPNSTRLVCYKDRNRTVRAMGRIMGVYHPYYSRFDLPIAVRYMRLEFIALIRVSVNAVSGAAFK
jgi:hypothetical protein